jgi:hypothetical protein
MTLDEFLRARQITTAQAADRLGRDQSLVGRYRRRIITPSPEIIAQIWEWTGGLVSPVDLLAVSPAVLQSPSPQLQEAANG